MDVTAIILLTLLVVSIVIATGSYMYVVGSKEERARCEAICRQSWERGEKLSPTARRIYFSIVDGRKDLISVDDFFG
jgi:hypothetical protein